MLHRLSIGLVTLAFATATIPANINQYLWPKVSAQTAQARASIAHKPLNQTKRAELKALADGKVATRIALEKAEAERKERERLAAEQARLAALATPAEIPRTMAPAVGGSGSCAAEIAKYDWNVGTATRVMIAESGGNPGEVNDNPSTGDYSVGCFQINLYGANARTRPSEAWLKNAANNVSYAYGIYKSNGSSFIGQWGVCRSKVNCY